MVVRRTDTLCAATVSGENVKATTVTATTFSGQDVKATTVTGTTFSGTGFSGSTATSAGGTEFCFTTAGAGKHLSAYSVGADDCISADALLQVTYGGNVYYIPCMSAFAKEA